METEPETPQSDDDGRTAEDNWAELGMTLAEAQEAIANSRKWESRAKANKAAAEELEQLKDAAKSDAQRQADAIAQAQRERDEAVAVTTRYEVASEYGLSPELLLASGDREAMAEHAARVRAALDAEAKAAVEDGKPRPPAPDPRQGTQSEGPSGSTADQFAAAIQRQFKQGS